MERVTLDPTILREYDIRGIVGKTLTTKDLRAIGRAFGTLVAGDGGRTAAVGFDGRLSSPDLEKALVGGLCACGISVVRVGRGPTPMLYYAAHTLAADGGLMITGSHNPPDYNGIKMVKKGRPFWGPDIQRLGRIAAAGEFAAGSGEAVCKAVIEEYVARVARDFKGEKRLRVAWDAGNGATGEALAMLTRRLPGEHILINAEIDGTFPNHHPDPTVEKNLEQLRAAVIENRCDVGIAFDGDGDRIGVLDGKGRVLWGDQVLVILAEEVLKRHPGATIIADVKASQVFFDEIARMGGKPVMGRTGHSLIKNAMHETGALLAGEMSAHIFFADGYYGYDDALYAAVRLLAILASSDMSLAERRDRLPQFCNTPELRIDCPEERKFKVIEEVKERLKGAKGITVRDIDGVRVENSDGWWLLRASNTQAVLVARCESRTQEGLLRLKKTLANELERSGIQPPDF
ncbi:MAG: phosphomannomutase/phosphoglucomutase [Rhodospirillales bacterium]|nr:phosphomannomutase/phosphoglucomutase [Rhodospirillales bacterium]